MTDVISETCTLPLTKDKNESHPLSIVIALNNTGVSLMEDGKINRAICCFQQSLNLTWGEMGQSNCLPSVEMEEECDPICSHAILPTRLRLLARKNTKHDCGGYIDWTALRLKGPTHFSGIDAYSLVSFVTTYNLAICHHFRGVLKPCNYDMKKSVRLYELAHGLLSQQSERHEDLWMLLTIVNNLSRALRRMGEEKRSTLCCRRVLAILVYVKNHEDLDMPAGLYDSYLSNVCHLILTSQTAAAA
eukprot:Nitzschia sp. Nitz4//scaffold71_size96697//94179//94916//NITZ4_004714-RA/size96697-processed-gene-0.54-mRNA-1//-1//CDS//3329557304//8619//frame0